MKLKTLSCNPMALRKDIFRFAPVWALYTILSITGVVNLMGFTALLSEVPEINAGFIAVCIGAFSALNMVYALITVLMLYGDLYNTRMCYALHAMPMRRENWFVTHTVAGLAFSIVPNSVICLCMMLFFGNLWYVALLWFLGMTLEYLFFFGLGSLCAVSTGKRFATSAVYLIVNFLAPIAALFVMGFYAPLLYGIDIRYDYFLFLSPVVWMCTLVNGLVKIEDMGVRDTELVVLGLTEHWWYLVAVAAIGIGLLALALVLYKRRKLESAGDFVAFKPMGSAFWVIVTLTAGLIFRTIGKLGGDGMSYVFLIVGIVVGFFVSRMLLERKVRVFSGKNFAKCGITTGVMLTTLLLVWWDPLGVTTWVPNPDRVASITISEENTSEYLYHFSEGADAKVTITDEDEIAELIAIHQKILEQERPEKEGLFGSYNYDYEDVSITYTMRSGRKVTRNYSYRRGSGVQNTLEKYYSRPEYAMQYQDWDAFLEEVDMVCVNWSVNYYSRDARELLTAIKADGEAVGLQQHYDFDNTLHIQILIDGSYKNFQITPKHTNAMQWLYDHGYTQYTQKDW